ncbi:hypothetical protein BJ546DRAFT_998936 [Cryomyces antarcticus]
MPLQVPFNLTILPGASTSSKVSAPPAPPAPQASSGSSPMSQSPSIMPDPLLANQKLGSSLLPASCRILSKDSDIIAIPEKDLTAFLTHELNVDRLNNIHKHLWMVGRPMPARALHQQRLLAREIVIVEQTDLHLVWSAKSICIKPLPRFLLDHSFWRDNMLCKNDCACITSQMKPKTSDEPLACTQRKLYRGALGFLLTYVHLISHESDFKMAKDAWPSAKESRTGALA